MTTGFVPPETFALSDSFAGALWEVSSCSFKCKVRHLTKTPGDLGYYRPYGLLIFKATSEIGVRLRFQCGIDSKP